MASGRQVEYSLKLNSNVSQVLNQADKDANKFDNSMWQVQKTLASFGLGLGAHFMIDAAKSWTQGAADYEQAMIRIKNASESGFGIKNQLFITDIVDKFKLDLQESADAYGRFLFKIKNANLDQSSKLKMFEEITTIGKVGGLTNNQMESTIFQLSTLLGEGVLEARHLRQLSMVHPQIMPFIADIIGLKSGQKDAFSGTIHETDDERAIQKLSQLMSSTKLTKMGLSSTSILTQALDLYYKSLVGTPEGQAKLNETLNTVQSNLNELSNTWLRFKNNMVLGQKPELLDFFNSLEHGVHWLVDHESEIINVSKSIFDIIKLYTEWRIALIALQAPAAIVGFFANEQARLASVLGVNLKNTADSTIANINHIESEEKLTSSVQLELEAEKNKLIELEKLKQSLSQVSIQTDLYTEAQIRNVEASSMFESKLVQLDMFEASAFRNFGLRTDGMQANLNAYMTTTSIANEQLSLFTNSELEMASAMKSGTDAVIMQNEAIAIQNNIMLKNIELKGYVAEATALGNAVNSLPSGTIGAAGIAAGASLSFLNKAIMPVFIAGMAAEVGLMFLNSGRISGDKVDFMDYLKDMAMILPESGKARRIDAENERFDMLVNGYTQMSNLMSGSGFAGGLGASLPRLAPSGHELFDMLSVFPDFLAKLDPADKFGKMLTSNIELYDILKSRIPNLPFLIGEDSGKGNDSFFPYVSLEAKRNAQKATTSGINIPKTKDTTHIRGNSSNYFTVNIGELNGMKNPKFENTNAATMQDVKTQVGVEITRIMLELINDVQVVRTH